MKRCIVCGNIGDDDSVVCNVCGNPFIDMENESDNGNGSLEPDERIEEQLKEVLTKVQDDEPVVQPDIAAELNLESASEKLRVDEPGVTVLPEEDFVSSVHQGKEPEEAFSQAAREPVQSAAEAFARRVAESSVKDETLAEGRTEEPTEKEPEAMARQDMEAPGQEESQALVRNEANAQRQARPRRTKSGPQIYGQDSMAEYDGAQGVIRRDVHGGHAGENVVYGNGVQNDPVQPRRRPENAQIQNTETPAQGRPVQRAADGRAAAGGGAAGNGNASKTAAQKQMPPVQPYAQTPQETRGGSQQAKHHSGQSAGMARRVMEASKDALTSPLLIVVALLQTAFLAGSVAAIFMRELSYGQVAKLLNLLNLPSQLSGYVSMFQSAMAELDKGALAINLVIRVPDLLLCLGLWLICILARASKEKMSGFGFVLVQIVTILEMIAACAVLLVVLILSVTLVIAAWSGGTQSLLIIAVATLIGAIIVTMAIVMYFFCYLSTIRIISTNARTGERCGKVSAYVAVIHMIFALTGIINILSGIVNLEVTGIVAGVGQLGWMLLFGIWILKYRSTLSEYNE